MGEKLGGYAMNRKGKTELDELKEKYEAMKKEFATQYGRLKTQLIATLEAHEKMRLQLEKTEEQNKPYFATLIQQVAFIFFFASNFEVL